MTRILFASLAATGHVSPLLSLAREAAARGHAVFVYTGDEYRTRVEALGATFLPFVDAPDGNFDDLASEFPDRPKGGIRQLRYDIRKAFVAKVPGQVADLERYIDRVRPDVIVAETGMSMSTAVVGARRGIPWAMCGVLPLIYASPETAPFGLGLQPRNTPLGRLRNRALHELTERLVYGPGKRDLDAYRDGLGLPAVEGGLMRAGLSPWLNLQPTVPSFEYPISTLPAHVHFVGPLLPPAPPGAALPSWWDDLRDDRPVVLVTQGTVATDPRELLLPALEALAGDDVLVVGTTGGPDVAELGPLPANARVERFVPFQELMPHVDAYVTNGGYGGLHFALSHGVPLVCAGGSEDKPEIVARVNWSGVGVGLRTQSPKPEKLRGAVRRVLGDPRYGLRVREIAAELAAAPGAPGALDLVERLAETGAPVTGLAARQALLAA
jgi:MGT family glycosyltransferase